MDALTWSVFQFLMHLHPVNESLMVVSVLNLSFCEWKLSPFIWKWLNFDLLTGAGTSPRLREQRSSVLVVVPWHTKLDPCWHYLQLDSCVQSLSAWKIFLEHFKSFSVFAGSIFQNWQVNCSRQFKNLGVLIRREEKEEVVNTFLSPLLPK